MYKRITSENTRLFINIMRIYTVTLQIRKHPINSPKISTYDYSHYLSLRSFIGWHACFRNGIITKRRPPGLPQGRVPVPPVRVDKNLYIAGVSRSSSQ